MGERQELTVLGRVIGTSEGWEQSDTEIFIFTNFEPAPGIELPATDLVVNYAAGLFEWDGDTVQEARDMIDLLMHLRRPR